LNGPNAAASTACTHLNPALVKMQSVWDKRTTVSGAWKLATSLGLERIFISPDEPLEVRRQKTMDRLKKKALCEGK